MPPIMEGVDPIYKIVTDCNTFEFFVKACHEPRRRTKPKSFKFVVVRQTTDFTGTSLEEDYPNGDVSHWTGEVSPDFTDVQCVNVVGRRIIHLDHWIDMQGEQTK